MYSRRRRRSICCCCVCFFLAILLGLGVMAFSLGFTFFKPKDPVITVDSISLADVDFAVDAPRLRVLLNVTIDAVVTVENPNVIGFRYGNSTGLMLYRGTTVGEVPIPGGRIEGSSRRLWNLKLALMADRLLHDPNFFSDAVSGVMGFQIAVTLPGKVTVIVDVDLVAYAICDVEIHLLARRMLTQTCFYRTKLS
ncbi:hypothetical protein M569_15096 [Genlisea aurea]|uniref:Late embryogenesis abundant protein LEA-2 subgroup domain-containing protein n=1 Tax=Genlisea aurea TaxID=192259 RepID=S8BZ54_9LAMI|nr:hypothetical protein M569_15096 [Genlisea aurea]